MMRFKSTLFALSLCAALVSGIALAAAAVNEGPVGGMDADMDAAGPALNTNEGHFLCTAAITSAGGVFSGQYVNGALTFRLTPAMGGLLHGSYQVAFLAPCPNVQIANGWFRICQIDTLTTGTVNGYCTVADRFGVPSAVFVETFNAAGVPTDLPFTLSVSR
jgi:hypothetical protein